MEFFFLWAPFTGSSLLNHSVYGPKELPAKDSAPYRNGTAHQALRFFLREKACKTVSFSQHYPHHQTPNMFMNVPGLQVFERLSTNLRSARR